MRAALRLVTAVSDIEDDVGGKRRPRILILTEFIPNDPKRDINGVFQRLRSHITGLGGIGQVNVAFFVSSLPDAKATAALKRSWGIDGTLEYVTIGGRRALSDIAWITRGAIGFFSAEATMRTSRRHQGIEVRRILNKLQPDLIFAHRLGAAAALLRAGVALPPVIVDVDDVEHLRIERMAVGSWRSAGIHATKIQSLLARHAERRIGKLADCLLVCSNLDRQRLQDVCRRATIATIVNTSPPRAGVAIEETRTAIFVGTADYAPNRDAILWLAAEVWPLVRARLPTARLRIIGSNSDRLGVASQAIGIEVDGFVPDLASIYGVAQIAVCPIRTGGGTRIKILEAAMNSRPVVSTEVGAEGLAFARGREILIADSAEDFANACVRLLSDIGLARKIGDAARARAEQNYSAASTAERLQRLCRALLDGSGSGVGDFALSHLPDFDEIGTQSVRQ